MNREWGSFTGWYGRPSIAEATAGVKRQVSDIGLLKLNSALTHLNIVLMMVNIRLLIAHIGKMNVDDAQME